jgi:hypothetical protein
MADIGEPVREVEIPEHDPTTVPAEPAREPAREPVKEPVPA